MITMGTAVVTLVLAGTLSIVACADAADLNQSGMAAYQRGDFEAAYDLVRRGRALPVVDAVFSLADAAAAHERLEAGEQLGKIVLRIPG